MFNWFTEKVATRVKEKLDRDTQEKKNNEAFEFGEKAADSMIADLDRFATHRFSQIEANVLQILASAMEEAIEQNKVPHITLAREELAHFIDAQQNNRERLVDEIIEGVSDWRDVFRKLDSDTTVQNIEPPRDCRRLQFLRRRSHHEQYNTPKETPQLCT